MQKKLTELIGQKQNYGVITGSHPTHQTFCDNETLAAHMIANGVTVRAKGEWKWVERNRSFWWRCSECGCTPDSISDFCPACGADMRGAEHESD